MAEYRYSSEAPSCASGYLWPTVLRGRVQLGATWAGGRCTIDGRADTLGPDDPVGRRR